MTDEDGTDNGLALIPVAIEVHRYLQKRGTYDKVRDWWQSNKPCDVIVLGASGTGKTALVKALRGLPHTFPVFQVDPTKQRRLKVLSKRHHLDSIRHQERTSTKQNAKKQSNK